MQDVRRKASRPRRARWLMLLAAVAALLLLLIGYGWLSGQREDIAIPETYEDTAEVLLAYEADEVASVAVTLRSGEDWAVVQATPGVLAMADDPAAVVDASDTARILEAARIVSCAAVLSDDPAAYRESLADFGLDQPRLIAHIAYTDGTEVTLRVGGAVFHDDVSWLYMTMDGDERLMAIDKGTADVLTTDRALLFPVTQPTLHQARFDRITLTGAGGALIGEWALEGEIGNADAGDRWQLVSPVRYPADAEKLASLRQGLASLRLGAYIGPATEESLAEYGFDDPRLTITIHQAAGSFGTTNAAGEYSLTDWPESTVTFVVGGARSEDIDYVLYENSVYISSHYLMAVFMDKDYADTLSRYIAPTALGNLARLTIERAAGVDEYVITRTEQVAENNELVTDMNGNVIYDYACTLNGTSVDYEAFAASYAQLITATVSGRLPAGWSVTEAPHTVYTFHDVSGDAHTVAFATFDALHDAVMIDGEAMFYLIKGGFGL